MKNAKRIFSILMTFVLLMMAMPMAVSAAGTQDDPIDAKTKWFGYGVDTYLLNPTIAEGSDGVWYTLTADKTGILFLEHSYKNVDYTITIALNGVTYEGGCVNGEPYNRPIVTAPIAVGDVATINIATKDAAAGTVYANMNIVAGDVDNPVKVKSNGLSMVIGAGETVYFQDDSLNAIYATMGMLVNGDVTQTTFYTVTKNTENGDVTKKAFTDTDGDGVLEVMLGGNLGGAGAPAVKPGWAIENSSNEDQWYTLSIVDAAHECNWDDDLDADCNTCGDIREVTLPCEHQYDNDCDRDCNLCDVTRIAPHNPVGDYDCNLQCSVCSADLATAEHTYSFDIDNCCNVCGEYRDVELPFVASGYSVSEEVDGLACRFDLTVEGMAVNGATAIYDNATFCGYKLISMGAVVCNNFSETLVKPTHDDLGDIHVTDVPAQYLYDFNADTGRVAFAIRIINIPDHGKDTFVLFNPYVVVEDEDGNRVTLYMDQLDAGCSYNEALAK